MSAIRHIRLWLETLESRRLLTSLTFVDHTVHEGSDIRLDAVVTSDLDGDDDLDLLSGNYWFENIDAQGHFASHEILGANISRVRVVYDIDLDRDVDILYGDRNGIWWLENRGNAEFAQGQLLIDELGTDRVITPGDFDADGDVDIAYDFDENYVQIAYNDGGSFGRRETLTGQPGNDGIAQTQAIDLDGNGWLDLVVTSDDGGMLSVYRNSSAGFTDPERPIPEKVGEYFYVEDFDNDGDSDLLVFTEVLVWYEQEDGFFTARHVVSSQRIGAAAASDFDNDGDIDVLTSDENGLYWLVSDGGHFSGEQFSVTAHPLSPLNGVDLDGDSSLAIADLDGDSAPEIVALRGRFELTVLRKGQSEYFSDVPIVSLPSSFDEVIVADMSGDSRADIVSVLETDGAIKWFEQSVDVTFEPGGYVTPRLSHKGSLSSMVNTDMDGDGDPDLVVSSMGPNYYGTYNIVTGERGGVPDFGGKLFWLENVGGSYVRHEISNVETRAMGRTIVSLGDLDDDGDLDIIVTRREKDRSGFNEISGQVIWFENLDSKGFFASEGNEIVRIEDAEILITVFDIDNDGDVDVVSSTQADDFPISQFGIHSRFGIHLNGGDGQFGEASAIENVESALLDEEVVTSLHSVDYDGDDDVDLVAATNQGGILIFVNDNGRISFRDRLENQFSNSEVAKMHGEWAEVKSSDLDRDGDEDLVASFGGLGRVVWFENVSGSGDFSDVHEIASNLPDLVTFGVGDVDGDGDEDVAAGSRQRYQAELHWYENRVIGDVNNDGRFDSRDIVLVLQSGEYEDDDDENSTFDEGDWNGDGDFDARDLALAERAGHYVTAAHPAARQFAAAADCLFAQDANLNGCGRLLPGQ